MSFTIVIPWDSNFAETDPGFPVGGGANFRRRHFSVKTYVKTKELDPVGGGGGANSAPLDPPMVRNVTLP